MVFFYLFQVAEVASAMMDAKLVSMFRKFPEAIDTIHFSDQYTGPKPADDQQPLELPQGMENNTIYQGYIKENNNAR